MNRLRPLWPILTLWLVACTQQSVAGISDLRTEEPFAPLSAQEYTLSARRLPGIAERLRSAQDTFLASMQQHTEANLPESALEEVDAQLRDLAARSMELAETASALSHTLAVQPHPTPASPLSYLARFGYFSVLEIQGLRGQLESGEFSVSSASALTQEHRLRLTDTPSLEMVDGIVLSDDYRLSLSPEFVMKAITVQRGSFEADLFSDASLGSLITPEGQKDKGRAERVAMARLGSMGIAIPAQSEEATSLIAGEIFQKAAIAPLPPDPDTRSPVVEEMSAPVTFDIAMVARKVTEEDRALMQMQRNGETVVPRIPPGVRLVEFTVVWQAAKENLSFDVICDMRTIARHSGESAGASISFFRFAAPGPQSLICTATSNEGLVLGSALVRFTVEKEPETTQR